ncbi:MAG: hypothetical protein OK452_02065 [Thaumarchaeota archaeon]|nr:hypothetical protein [Nitrososphaerota archaeon]
METTLGLSATGLFGPLILIFAILRLAWGFVLGLVFAAFADRIMPARSYRTKGVVYGLILGFIEFALNLASLVTGIADVAFNLVVGLIISLIFGYVLGYFYEVFAQKTASAGVA